MTVKRPKFASAGTLIEVMLAMAILSIAALGALGSQYYTVGHVRIARAETIAVRTALLLLEDWKSTGGSEDYDLAALGLGFSPRLFIPSQWSQGHGGGLGSPLHNYAYAIVVDGLPMLVTLRWEDVADDSIAEIKLRQLAVVVRFGEIDNHGNMTFPESYLENILSLALTTYVRLDASGG
ncbi:MAG: prepilin-type N-terminal cleavage/methylation domain-containing protein [Phycisphaerae bacterium]|nr:prepilin-type N-terminal cleavage/methylation domain-containing protein [Phycisphaerae bacterium]MDD5380353.1 prepilin-type N-terminal cleavage/methylation domain-containing protein [Phycisphaerae bacterium]